MIGRLGVESYFWGDYAGEPSRLGVDRPEIPGIDSRREGS